MAKQKIIFISHDASRSGAPIVFLHLLKWLKNNTKISFKIVLQNGGELENEFKSLAETITLNNAGQSISQKALQKFILYPSRVLALKNMILSFKPTLIYANTIVTLDLVSQIKDIIDCPIICNIHELDSVIKLMGLGRRLKQMADYIDQFLVVARPLKDNLIKNYNIPAKKILVLPEFIPSKKIAAARHKKDKKIFTVGGCGRGDWRKGIDLFVLTAAIIKKKGINKVKFVWVGNIEGEETIKVKHDITKLGIENIVELTGASTNPQQIFRNFDCFFLSSREDPYPLVALEAAAMGKPIICFDKGGGMVDFVGDDCGFIVPYLDIDSASKAIIKLKQDIGLKRILGNNAKKKALLHDIDIIAPKIYNVIERITIKKEALNL